jgi:molecular chaperone GrpE
MQDETQEVQNEEVSADAKAAEYLAGWKRAQADYTNLQKEVAVQRAEMGKHATAEVVLGFLPVYDYFKRALAHQPPESEQSASVKNWFIGTQHIAGMFKMTLSQFGVDELEVKGKPFDPHSMDAINEEVREGVAAGTVIEEIEGGYKMGDKILKASKVIVAK